MPTATTLFFLLIVASVVAMLARRLRLPYTVTLVVAGLALGTLEEELDFVNLEAIHLTPELLFTLLLPALLFEAAFHLSWPKFKENLRAILILAVPGVIAAIGIAGLLAYWLEPLAEAELPLMVAFLFVAMCAATDPVSVIALFKELGVPKRLAVLMEGESLLNDGIAVVAFIVLSAVLGISHTGEEVSAMWAARFPPLGDRGGARRRGGGRARRVLRDDVGHRSPHRDHADDHRRVRELPARGGRARLAGARGGGGRHGHGERGRALRAHPDQPHRGRELLGVRGLRRQQLRLPPARQGDRSVAHVRTLGPILVAWVSLTAARAIVIFGVERLLARTTERLPPRWSAVLIWGGLRGSLSMVLALSLPRSFEHREILVDLVFGVVLLSILVQGLTMSPLLRWSGAIAGGTRHLEYMKLRGKLRAARAALRRLDESLTKGEIHQSTYDRLRAGLSGREASLEEQIESLTPGSEERLADELSRAEAQLFDTEREAIQEAAKAGLVTDEVARELLEDVLARSLGRGAEPEAKAEPPPRARGGARGRRERRRSARVVPARPERYASRSGGALHGQGA
ncbi:MAG: cation:proton antiporter [Sandaracinaceae bacterium]|nr:cation:proton antiporter [Sandaracinaceae bacterium]